MTRETSFSRRRRYFVWREKQYKFLHSPWAGGVVLVIFALIAMVLANLEATKHAYHTILTTPLTIGFEGFQLSKSVEHWINDGLMVLFFFYVGLEIKREIIAGQLASLKQAVLPIAAAIGGMIVPAILYTAVNAGNPYEAGWGIPMATDIAFAIGILSLLGNRVPVSLKIFLTALAIVDDLGAILVIALFYSSEINFMMLIAAGGVMAFLILLNRLNVYSMRYYIIPSVLLWILFLYSGIHATIAGVLIAMTLPATPRFSKPYFLYKTNYYLSEFKHYDRPGVEVLGNPRLVRTLMTQRQVASNAISPLQRLEYSLHLPVSFFIMPVFALANAGVEVANLEDLRVLANPQGLGIFLGLVLGKPLGIFLLSYLVAKIGWGQLPSGASWKALWGVAMLGGIGFTMSIFIDNLAFDNPAYVATGKIAILIASFAAALLGLLFMRMVLRPRPKHER